jgi:hypothetical protein
MNDKILEICALQSKMYDQMMKIDEAVLKATQMDEVVASVNQLVKDVQKFGYTDLNVERIKRCESLKEFCNVDLCLKYKSTEAFSMDTVKEAFKKFLKMISDVIAKVMEFLQDLFTMTSAKCRQIIKDRSLIKFDKPVDVITKDDMNKVMISVEVCKNFLDQHVKITSESVGSHSQLPQVLSAVETGSKGIIVYSKESGKVSLNPPSKSTVTLTDAGYDVNDVTGIASAYLNKSNSYTAIGAFMKSYTAESLLSKMNPYDDDYTWMKAAIRANASIYSVLAKTQSLIVNNIHSFWKCIDDSDVVVVAA